MNEEKKTISELIRYYRVYVKHMTQEEFATEYCGIATRTLQTWESGKKLPSIKSLRLAFKDNMDILDEAIELRERHLIEQKIVTDEKEFLTHENADATCVKNFTQTTQNNHRHSLADIFNLNRNIKDNARRWTSINNVVSSNNNGPVKVLGNNFMVPIDEKGNMITRNGRLNGNTLVIGSVGSGKTAYYILPNIINNLGKKNFVWIDCGYTYEQLKILMPGYDIKYLSSKENIDSYNPFDYVTCQKDIIALVNAFCDANKHEMGTGDPFFSIAQKNWLYALFTYVYTMSKEKQTFETLCNIYKSFKTVDDIKHFVTELTKKDSTNPALDYFKTFFNSSHKTAESILMSTGVMLSFCLNSNVVNKLSNSTFNIDDVFTKENQAIVISHDYINDAKAVVNMFSLQTILRGYLTQETTGINNKLVDIYFDEFANNNYESFLPYYMATNRNYGINIHILMQSLSQGDAIYDNFEVIEGNCDTKVFMGFTLYSDAETICEEYFRNSIGYSMFKISPLSERYIVDPNYLLTMPYERQLIFIRTYEPMNIDKAKPDKVFLEKLRNAE